MGQTAITVRHMHAKCRFVGDKAGNATAARCSQTSQLTACRPAQLDGAELKGRAPAAQTHGPRLSAPHIHTGVVALRSTAAHPAAAKNQRVCTLLPCNATRVH